MTRACANPIRYFPMFAIPTVFRWPPAPQYIAKAEWVGLSGVDCTHSGVGALARASFGALRHSRCNPFRIICQLPPVAGVLAASVATNFDLRSRADIAAVSVGARCPDSRNECRCSGRPLLAD